MNLSAVAALSVRPETRVWYRAIAPGRLETALDYNYTRIYPTRFHASSDPFEIVYLAETQEVALFESRALFGSPSNAEEWVSSPVKSYVMLNLYVQLSSVADLTDPEKAQRPLGTTAQELTGDWEGYRIRRPHSSVPLPAGIAPTQELGRALYDAGTFEGFLTLSAKLPDKQVLGVFPGRIRAGNFVRYSYSGADGQPRTFQIPT